ncbi:MAG: threonine dehydratase [Gaiellaceae bacterium]|nr:threonine dehydratase [Gaiellaceae bacterium]
MTDVQASPGPVDALTADVFSEAQRRIAPHVHRTPVLRSATLSRETGYDVRLKAELFQRTGSYKIRGPSNKLPQLSDDQKRAGVICSSAGNHAQGVALAAAQLGIPAVVVMAANATPSKIAATKGYGAEVVLHGEIWDEANAEAERIAAARGLTMVHPFDDVQLIAGQGTVGLEILEDVPDVDVVVVPIGGGGLISGVAAAIRTRAPEVRIIGVESSGAPAMQRSVEAGSRVTLDEVNCSIDGLKVKQVGEQTLALVQRYVEKVVTLDDEAIFAAALWTMSRCKLVVEGAAAAPVAALRAGLIDAEPGATVVCVLSGGNIDLERLSGQAWN